jgi:uncharacterized protein YigE (DUF2233 family)
MMIKVFKIIAIVGFVLAVLGFSQENTSNILSYEVNPKTQDLKLYWKDSYNKNYLNFKYLRTDLAKQNKKLVFAMNGGMYLKDHSPQGLFIENGIPKKRVDTTQDAYGNFYMQPNGIFYLTSSKEAVVCKTTDFKNNESVQYATQSGPMLLINGELHPRFIKGSTNLHIRNGVGILPNGNVLFAMSKERINFYDFATFFKKRGCKNALYLDGFVSRTYLPSQNWEQLDGGFGVIIGVVG